MNKEKLKVRTAIFLLFALCTTALPILAVPGEKNPIKSAKTKQHSTVSSSLSSVVSAKEKNTENGGWFHFGPKKAKNEFKILDTSNGKILNVSEEDFLKGGIAAEISPTDHIETLKAQGVALATYYKRLQLQNQKSKPAALKGADFTCDTKNWRIYETPEQRKKRWGKHYEEYDKKLSNAVRAIYGQTLQKDGKPICATYFAISSGNTDSASDIWGGTYSYLVPVASPGDVYAHGYLTTARISDENFQKYAKKMWPNIKFSQNPETWITKITRLPSGCVKTAQIGDQTVSGSSFRSAMNLRSANFTAKHKDGYFIFTVKGWGHNVGMSQAGAEYMAANGAGYKEILAWYYPGSRLVKK